MSVTWLPIHQLRKYQRSAWVLLLDLNETDSNETALSTSQLNLTWLFYLPGKLFGFTYYCSILFWASKALQKNFTFSLKS